MTSQETSQGWTDRGANRVSRRHACQGLGTGSVLSGRGCGGNGLGYQKCVLQGRGDGDFAPQTMPQPGIAFEMDGFQVDLGAEIIRKTGNGGRYHIGISGGLGEADYTIDGVASRTDFDSSHIGAYITWESGDGFYLDAVMNYHWFDVEFEAPAENSEAQTDANAWVMSFEAGKRFTTESDYDIIPEVQLIYADIDFDSFTDTGGLDVTHLESKSLKGRLGVRLQRVFQLSDASTIKPFITLDLMHEFKGDAVIDISGLDLSSTFDGTSYGIGGGFEFDFGSSSIYLKGSWEKFDSSQGDLLDLIAGFKFRW